MAQIHRSKNTLKKNLNYNRKRILLIWVIYWVCLLFGLPYLEEVVYGSVFTFIFMLSIYFSYDIIKENRILKVGLKGEKNTLKLIEGLDETYHVFTSLIIEHENRQSELDILAVGEKGVFVVEVKNYNGKITGEEEERFWTQLKYGSQGGEYNNELYNPTKQVRTHVYKIANILKDEGIHLWVQGMVFFSNQDVELNVKTEKIPVLKVGDGLVDYINSVEVNKTLNKEEIEKIVKIIDDKNQN